MCLLLGPVGRVLALDATPAMLAEARRLGRNAHAALLLGDAHRLPLATGACAAVFAGGLLPHLDAHLDDPAGALREIARVTRPEGRLAVFHPLGRAALAARHGRSPADDDVIAPAHLTALLRATGWAPESVDDAAERYLALATRMAPAGAAGT